MKFTISSAISLLVIYTPLVTKSIYGADLEAIYGSSASAEAYETILYGSGMQAIPTNSVLKTISSSSTLPYYKNPNVVYSTTKLESVNLVIGLEIPVSTFTSQKATSTPTTTTTTKWGYSWNNGANDMDIPKKEAILGAAVLAVGAGALF